MRGETPPRGHRPSALDGAIVALALLLAFGLKLFYSVAGAAELAWVLAPTAHLVALATGADYVVEAQRSGVGEAGERS